jgi:hypothetical protein
MTGRLSVYLKAAFYLVYLQNNTRSPMKTLIGFLGLIVMFNGCSSGSDSNPCPDIPQPTPLTISGHIIYHSQQPLDSAKLICYWRMPDSVNADPKYISGHGTLFDARDSFWITLDGTPPNEMHATGANCHAAALASGGYIVLTSKDGRFLGAVDSLMAFCVTANYPMNDTLLHSLQGGYRSVTNDSIMTLRVVPNTNRWLIVDSSRRLFHFPNDPFGGTAIQTF